MDLTFLGHASFRLHSAGMVVITDPFPESLGLRIDPRPAAVVTVSNPHPNHAAANAISGAPKVFRAPRRIRIQRHHRARRNDPPCPPAPPTSIAT